MCYNIISSFANSATLASTQAAKRLDIDRSKPALNDIKNAPSIATEPRPSEKTESPVEVDYSIYDEVKGRAVDERAVWAEEGILSDEDINRWIKNILEAGSYKDEPEMPDCIEPELHFMEEPEMPLPEPPSWEECERMYAASIAEATLRDTDMRSNLSLPYGDESSNRSVFELSLSDSDDEWDAEEHAILKLGF